MFQKTFSKGAQNEVLKKSPLPQKGSWTADIDCLPSLDSEKFL
jgi:hypothetical protein